MRPHLNECIEFIAELHTINKLKVGRETGCVGKVEHRTVNRGDGDSIPLFWNLGNFVHPTFACVFWKTLKAGVPFYHFIVGKHYVTQTSEYIPI